MSQVPVKRYKQLDDCEILESPDGEWIELAALREVVENMCDQAITNMEADRQPSCSCYLDGLNNLLALLGEE